MIFQGAGQIRSHVGDAIGQNSPEYERARRFQDALRQGMDNSQAAAFVDEIEFEAQHGISRQQWLAARAAWARQDYEAELLSSVEGELPFDPVPDTPAAESNYRNYNRWVSDLEKDVQRLERVVAGVEADMQAVPSLKERRTATLTRLARSAAAWLSGESQEEPQATELTSLDVALVEASARAEISAAAAGQVERRLADRRMQLDRLRQRRDEFKKAALRERFEHEVEYGKRKLKAQLKSVSEYYRRVAALARAAEVNFYTSDFGLNFAPTSVEVQAVEAITKSWETPLTNTNTI
jgi:hypothetical protein